MTIYVFYNILYDYVFFYDICMPTFSMIFLWLRFIFYINVYVLYDICMTTFSTILLWLRVLCSFLWLRFLWYFYDHVFYVIFIIILLAILYTNRILDNHMKTSSTYLISSFAPVSSCCLNKYGVVSAFIGSGGSGLNNNNTNWIETWK